MVICSERLPTSIVTSTVFAAEISALTAEMVVGRNPEAAIEIS
jgi:hypothetical protein